jgi:probable F420-dependent oxidoreductase
MAASHGKLGLATLALAASPLAQCSALAREAEDLGYTSLWVPEVAGPDALVSLAACALATDKVDLATGVIPIQIRTPGVMAMGFLTLNELSGGRAVAGLGVSSPVIVERWHGASYTKPLTAMRECVTIMRQHFRLGMRRSQSRPPRIYIAALNAPMLRLAGELADGVLLNYSPPEAMAPMIAEIHRGAKDAGRSPDAVDIGIYVRMCITDDQPSAVAAFKRELAGYAFVDAYNQMFSRYGLADELAEVRRRWKEGKRDEAPDSISEASARRIAVFGPASAGRDYIAEFRAAGVTHPVVFPIGPSNTIARDFPNTMRALAGA